MVSVVSPASLSKSASSVVVLCVEVEVEVEVELVKDGWVKQATRTGWRVVLGGNESLESNADKAVGVGILLGGVLVVGRGDLAKVIGDVEIVRVADEVVDGR